MGQRSPYPRAPLLLYVSHSLFFPSLYLKSLSFTLWSLESLLCLNSHHLCLLLSFFLSFSLSLSPEHRKPWVSLSFHCSSETLFNHISSAVVHQAALPVLVNNSVSSYASQQWPAAGGPHIRRVRSPPHLRGAPLWFCIRGDPVRASFAMADDCGVCEHGALPQLH